VNEIRSASAVDIIFTWAGGVSNAAQVRVERIDNSLGWNIACIAQDNVPISSSLDGVVVRFSVKLFAADVNGRLIERPSGGIAQHQLEGKRIDTKSQQVGVD